MSASTVEKDAERRLPRFRHPRFLVPAGILFVLVVVALFPQVTGAGDPRECLLERSLQRPSLNHPFGFDVQGCDYFSRTIYGTRASLAIGVSVVTGAAAIGVVLGSLAGFYGGIADAVIGRVSDVLLAMPLVLTGAVILTLIESRGTLHVIVVLVVLGWPAMVRFVRAQVLQTKNETYVDAARALGASDLRLLRNHVLPNALWPIVVYASAYIAVAITAEAILSFFGAGLQLPDISWGLMIGQARTRILDAPHLLIPAVFLSVTVAAFVFLGEALRATTNPVAR